MTAKEFDAEAYAIQTAAALGLPIAADHLPGVVLNLQRSAELVALLTDFELSVAEDEPAPIFRP